MLNTKSKKQREQPEAPLNVASNWSLPKTYSCSYQAKTRQCPSARGGCWIFCRKKMSERSELFFQKRSNSHPASLPAQPEGLEQKPDNQRPSTVRAIDSLITFDVPP